MKMFTLICMIAAASIASAQTENTGPIGADTVKPEIKKVTKKTKKAVSKTTGQKVIEVKKVVADTEEVNTTITTTTVNPATGTSEVTIANTVAPAKNWSALVATDVWVGTQAANIEKEKAQIGSENFVGAAYKVTADTAVGFRQYFDYTREAGAPAGQNGLNGIYTSYTALSLMPRFGGLFGSKDIKPNFMFFIPTRAGAEHFERDNGITAARNNGFTNDELAFNGYLRADAELAYEITPMLTLAYNVSLRQFLFPEQTIVKSITPTETTTVSFEDTTRYIHAAFAYLNVNDFVMPYAYVGMDHRWSTATATLDREDFIAAIGSSFTYGMLNITPEINNRTVMKKNFVQNSQARAFDAGDLSYELYTTVSF